MIEPLEFPFGKYKGELFFDAINISDPAYWCWCLLQPSLWKRYRHTLEWIWQVHGAGVFEVAVAEAERRGREL